MDGILWGDKLNNVLKRIIPEDNVRSVTFAYNVHDDIGLNEAALT